MREDVCHREISCLSSLAQPFSHSVSITSMLKPMNTRKNSFFMIHNPPKLVHMQRRALAAESDYVRKIASSQSSSSLSFSADAREKGWSLFSFSLIGHIQLLISLPPCLGSGGSRIAASRRLPLFPRKEGQGESGAFTFFRKAHSARRFPLKDIACVLFAQTKDAKIVCERPQRDSCLKIHM